MGDPPTSGFLCVEIVGPKKPVHKPSRPDQRSDSTIHQRIIPFAMMLYSFFMLCFPWATQQLSQLSAPKRPVKKSSRPGEKPDSAPYHSFRSSVLLSMCSGLAWANPHLGLALCRNCRYPDPRNQFISPADRTGALIQNRIVPFVDHHSLFPQQRMR